MASPVGVKQGLSVSIQWREKGNDFYRSVTDGLSSSVRAIRLQNAINMYYRALTTATKQDERSSACKNYAMASWKLAKAKIDNKASQTEITFCFKQALKHFQNARDYGKGRDHDWHDALIDASLNCWSDFRERVDEWETEEQILELEKLVSYLIHDRTKAAVYLEITNHYFNWAVINIGHGAYQQSLDLLAQCYFPLNECLRLGGPKGPLVNECLLLKEDIFIQQCVAESVQARIRGEELLEYIVRDEEILNIDMVWEVVDWFRRAAQLTRDQDLESEAMALSSLGKVYDKILMLKDRAKTCLMKVLELANSLIPRNISREEWYEFARSTIERYQQEQIKAEEDQEKKKKEETLQLIKEDVDILKTNHRTMSKEAFLVFVYATYPPKNPEHKLDKVSGETSEMKKLYQKAIIHYHPDKVQECVHGAKWKVLTEEITKFLTAHYERFKVLDGNS